MIATKCCTTHTTKHAVILWIRSIRSMNRNNFIHTLSKWNCVFSVFIVNMFISLLLIKFHVIVSKRLWLIDSIEFTFFVPSFLLEKSLSPHLFRNYCIFRNDLDFNGSLDFPTKRIRIDCTFALIKDSFHIYCTSKFLLAVFSLHWTMVRASSFQSIRPISTFYCKIAIVVIFVLLSIAWVHRKRFKKFEFASIFDVYK